MMRAEPHKEERNIYIVTRSGIAIGEDKGKKLETEGWVHNAVEKGVGFNLSQAKETFMEAKNSFVEASTSRIHKKSGGNNEAQVVDPLLFAIFINTCIKLLQDIKAIEGLQELTNNCTRKVKTPP